MPRVQPPALRLPTRHAGPRQHPRRQQHTPPAQHTPLGNYERRIRLWHRRLPVRWTAARAMRSVGTKMAAVTLTTWVANCPSEVGQLLPSGCLRSLFDVQGRIQSLQYDLLNSLKRVSIVKGCDRDLQVVLDPFGDPLTSLWYQVLGLLHVQVQWFQKNRRERPSECR